MNKHRAFFGMGVGVGMIIAAVTIHILTFPTVKVATVCHGDGNCLDLFGKPDLAAKLGATMVWSMRNAQDPSGFCKVETCFVKTLFDQVGDQHITQTTVENRPIYQEGQPLHYVN